MEGTGTYGAGLARYLAAEGVATVGDVPRGLPLPLLPDLDLVTAHAATIAIAALALVLIGFSQTAGDARVFAARHQYDIDVNQESVAQGMANVGAGFLQGMPVSTSLSVSSLSARVTSLGMIHSLFDSPWAICGRTWRYWYASSFGSALPR